MLFDRISELINDENAIVTFKSLSESCKIHVNRAKRVLDDYRKAHNQESVQACYIITGVTSGDKNSLLTKIVIVPESQLEIVKSSFKEVTSCHIYCLQKFHVKDGGTIYTNEAVKPLPRGYQSAIQNKDIAITQRKVKTDLDIVEKEVKSEVVAEQKKRGISSPIKKTNPLAAAFAKSVPAASKKESENRSLKNKTAAKNGKKTLPTSNALFSYVTKAAVNKTPICKSDVEKPLPPPVKEETIKESVWTSSDEEDEEEEIRQPAKRQRRRIQPMSDSESEEDIKKPLPTASLKKETSEESEMDEEPIPPTPEPRIRSQYKLVTKTYEDEDGFFVTKKEKELIQEEVDSEDPLPPPAKKAEKVSPDNIGAKKKQSSLTSFFSKK